MAPDSPLRIGRGFFERPTEEVAADLIGCRLYHVVDGIILGGVIVETEAYLDASDLASHAAWNRRGQETMVKSAGLVYMYRAYGIHMMFNIVAREPSSAGAVLIRAVEPVDNVEVMRERRGVLRDTEIASGPGKVCQAFGFNLSHHLVDLVDSDHAYLTFGTRAVAIARGPRIGISRSPELLLRFIDPESRHVSATRRGIVTSTGEAT